MADKKAIQSKLEKSRLDLLDLSARNRLINISRSSSRSGRLEIVDELADQIFRILVDGNKPMTFLPSEDAISDKEGGDAESEGDAETVLMLQPDEDDEENIGVAARHTDTRLQTTLAPEQLQRKLLKLYYEARTFEEDQGVNSLYLAVGFLKWFEDEKSDKERFAPLLLIPVELDRKSASAKFRLKYTEDDIATNLSLQEKLKAEFGLRLPNVSDEEDISPSKYFGEVRKAIKTKTRWQVLDDDMVLWFFSFSKFLMYRDLQPDTWPGERQIEDHPLLDSLLGDGLSQDPPIIPEDENVDHYLSPLDMIHVMDADSSQSIAIEEVRQGRNLVIQGPPGTGKSQTITNLIATAVKEGKKVLFVAEKMAALEVVKRRLDAIGLGDMCLELHSHKTNKKAVLQELERTLDLLPPKNNGIEKQAEDLQQHRDKLNQHAEILHTPIQPSSVTPYRALGELVRLRAAGVKPADFRLAGCLTWSSDDKRVRDSMLQDLALHLRELGNPRKHPWRGVRLKSALRTDVDRIAAVLPDIIARVDSLLASSHELASLMGQSAPETLRDCSAVGQFAKCLINAPPMDHRAIGSPVWADHRNSIEAVLEAGVAYATAKIELKNIVAPVAWETNVLEARRHLAAHGRSWLRFFKGDYRRAQAVLRGILQGDPPSTIEEQLQLLDDLILAKKALKTLEDPQNCDRGQSAFGDRWSGLDSDWKALRKIASWEAECRESKIPGNFRDVRSRISDATTVLAPLKKVSQNLKPLLKELQSLQEQLNLDIVVAFHVKSVADAPLGLVKYRIQDWLADPEAIMKWICYDIRIRNMHEYGLGPLADKLDKAELASDEAVDYFNMAYFEDVLREAFRLHPELTTFNGASHEQLLDKFCELDVERISMARQQVAMAHYEGLPSRNGDSGEVGILRHEMKKKRKHLPLRKLLQQAGHAVQAVKPVFMMSPLSIAQYLEPGILEFDLLFIDEASQVRPVDALGAIARAQQIAVVGDERQLPPTTFFSQMVDDVDDDSEEFQAGDVESILGLCEAQNVPQRMLRWHYRSRHHSLIALSNYEFYRNRLYVVPSPSSTDHELGLQFHHVANGSFDRGGKGINEKEAAAIAEAVMEHARHRSDKTLGVGAFSVRQRDAILNEVELRRRQAPELESFFASSTSEPFFVKNLENIQGDERDVILISIGYAKDTSDYMSMNFGPLNRDGGERRLNVLITRARERCVVFSSITADDIDMSRTSARGVQALKNYLTYARTGYLDAVPLEKGGFDSPFEEQVAFSLKGQGLEVESQIGVAGFFIDLGIVDPDQPGRYLLGIECDGASYHSSRSARDRDRIRQQVLEDRGWQIHRIWSTDWFNRPEEQLRKVMAAVENAKALRARRSSGESPSWETASAPSINVIDRHETGPAHDDGGPEIDSVLYTEANLSIDSEPAIHELPVDQLATIVTKVIDIEGPIHHDEVVRRMTSLWNLQRAGSRIEGAVDNAIDEAAFHNRIVQEGSFFRVAGQSSISIRNREGVTSANLRKPDYLPPSEVREAITAVVRVNLGISFDEAAREVAQLFGLRATSALKQVIRDELDGLLSQQVVEQRNDKLYVGDAFVPTS